jgi:hypothetical protein
MATVRLSSFFPAEVKNQIEDKAYQRIHRVPALPKDAERFVLENYPLSFMVFNRKKDWIYCMHCKGKMRLSEYQDQVGYIRHAGKGTISYWKIITRSSDKKGVCPFCGKQVAYKEEHISRSYETRYGGFICYGKIGRDVVALEYHTVVNFTKEFPSVRFLPRYVFVWKKSGCSKHSVSVYGSNMGRYRFYSTRANTTRLAPIQDSFYYVYEPPESRRRTRRACGKAAQICRQRGKVNLQARRAGSSAQIRGSGERLRNGDRLAGGRPREDESGVAHGHGNAACADHGGIDMWIIEIPMWAVLLIMALGAACFGYIIESQHHIRNLMLMSGITADRYEALYKKIKKERREQAKKDGTK